MTEQAQTQTFLGMPAVVESDAMKRLLKMAERVAASPATVLRTGESGSGKDLIAKLAVQIGGLPNKVLIEGHTDAKPFAGTYSNWELSAERANEARKVMMENGMRPDQVAQIRGFADQNLRTPNDPENPSNRRVSIIIQYLNAVTADLNESQEAATSEKAAAEEKHAAPKASGH